jgi:uridine kinase
MKIDIVGLVDSVRTSARREAMPTRIVAIDGCGGAGKSTLARQLAAALDGAPIIPNDDFANRDNQFDW